MPNKNKTTLQDLPRLVISVSLIVGIGAAISIAAYFYAHEAEIVSVKKSEMELSDRIIGIKAENVDKVDEIRDWKKYENKEYGFAINYPSDWEIDNTGYEKEQVYFSDTKNEEIFVSVGVLSAFDDSRNRLITFEEMQNDIKKGLLEQVAGVEKIRENKVVISDVPAYNISFAQGEKYADSYFMLRDNEVIIISCGNENLINNYCETVFKKMLSSFKLIEKSKKAFLGVYYKDIIALSEEEKTKLEIPKDLNYGALVISENIINEFNWNVAGADRIGDGIADGSPAEIAGLVAGDVILELNGEKAMTLEELQNKYAPQDKVKLKIRKQGKEEELEVILAEFPESLKP